MPSCKPRSDRARRARAGVAALAVAATGLVALAGAAAGCSARTLVVVDPCPDATTPNDGGTCTPNIVTQLRQGLVGLWHFEDGAGSKTAADSSGNGNTGTLVGLDPATAWGEGHKSGALATRAMGYANVPFPSSSIAGITSGVTVAAWVYFEGPIDVDYATAISRQIGNGVRQYYHLAIFKEGSIASLWISTTVADVHVTGPTIKQNVWTHLAGTYDGSDARLYVNGSEVGSFPVGGQLPSDTTPVILGGNGNDDQVTELFPGRVDEIALYNRALALAEIQALAAGDLAQTPPADAAAGN